MTSRVSVIIPAYNSARFLPEAIESVLKQTYPVFEIIVVDDGSTDETKAVCSRYPTIKYIYQSNQGLIGARNTGFDASTGEYILFFDSDDCLLRNAVESGVNAIEAHPEVGFVFGNYVLQSLNPDGSYITEEIYDNKNEVANYENILAGKIKMQCACVLFRRTAINIVGAFDPNSVGGEDYNLFLRVSREFPIHFHGQTVLEYRYNGSNMSAKPTYLINTLRAHSLQIPYIKQTGNQKYLEAYEQGRQAWIKLFVERMPYEIMRFTQSGQWLDALGYLQLLLNYDPKLKFVDQKIYEISYQALLSQLRKLPIDSSLAYWKEQLAGMPALLSLPTDHPRPPEQNFRGSSQPFVIDQELTQALNLLSKQEDVTLYITLLAAFNILLSRYTAIEDVVVGSPISTEIDSKIFVNAVLLRTDLSGNPSFHKLLERVKKLTSEANLHKEVPYYLLLEELNPSRDLSYSPLFQVTFVFEEEIPLQKIDLSILTASPWVLENNEGKYDLNLFIKETSNGLEGYWVYNTDLFDTDTINRLNGHFQTLLADIIANPQQSISELTLLIAKEQQELLVEWNNTQTDYLQNKCIHQLFEAQVELTPDAVAVVFEDQKLTYRELNSRANQLAHYLQSLGIKPESLVGICLERSLEMVIGLLGIQKAGGAYVPIDPNYPSERITYMLEDSKVPVLLIQNHLAETLPEYSGYKISLDLDWGNISSQSIENVVSEVTDNNLIYIIYTSGSTGKPKGTMNTHKGVVNRILWMQDTYQLRTSDRVLQKTPFSFDVSGWEFWWPLTTGACLVVAKPEGHKDSNYLVELITSQQITTLHFVPSMLQIFLLDPLVETCITLRLVFCSGEALPVEVQERFFNHLNAELHNLYGPTEAAIDVTFWQCQPGSKLSTVPIGRPVANTQTYILDSYLKPVPIGVPGELFLGGVQLARGYLNRPELTAERFINNPFAEHFSSPYLYKTGDLARYLSDGNIEYLGRLDNQVKIRGFRIELGEIEAVLSQNPAIAQTVIMAQESPTGDKRLVAYIVLHQDQKPTIKDLRDFLGDKLPDYMIPSDFVTLSSLPITPNGKVDRKALLSLNVPANKLKPERKDITTPTIGGLQSSTVYTRPQNETEKILTSIWQEVLAIDEIGIHDNFFELGGHSLLVAKLRNQISEIFGWQISIVDVFQYPTIHTLTEYLVDQNHGEQIQKQNSKYKSNLIEQTASTEFTKDIAIIGMSGRFPGAANIDEFWQNLHDGVESIVQLSDEELRSLGVDSSLLNDPNYIKVAGLIPKIEEFDASFFGYSPGEAQVIDPQQRFYLECAWEALENAGYQPDSDKYTIGVYGGIAPSSYLLNNICQNEDLAAERLIDSPLWLQAFVGNSGDFVTTRVAYKLNLTGPAINVQTACSTSLVAVHMACQSLLKGECDIALAGGVSLQQKAGYFYQEGMIFSPDGHCHAFDANAKGMVSGDGVAIVVLKPLKQAIADGDYIYATIKGSAINNDGNLKVGFTAPGVDGQAAVIAAAQRDAGIEPETITYVETHGTGTPLGDPIEVAGLTQAFRLKTDKKGYCAIGSVKTNVGHLNTAAGVTALIKTALALKHEQIPPSLNFEKPNPEIDFENSPFYVNTKLSAWEINGFPRRAGVSAFGFGGTNAHVVLEEWNDTIPKSKVQNQKSKQLLVLSAKTASALDSATINLATHLKQNPEINLADVAYTLSIGRVAFNHRRIVVVSDVEDAVNTLNTGDKKRIFTNSGIIKPRSVVFMFSGQGSQYVNMGQELYETEDYFREQINLCCEILQPHLGFDLRDVLYPNAEEIEAATAKLTQTATTQPALFVIEYALAQLWIKWGIRPVAMIGHSIGEYVAATLAEVFSLEDALALVAARGQLMQSMASGSMLAVPLSENQIQPLLAGTSLQIAVINSPYNCVVSGTTPAIEAFAKLLEEKDIEARFLHTSHAFHSQMMEEILEPFTDKVKQIRLNEPKIPFVSNVTGTWITVEDATNSSYYAQHLRQTVRFADGVKQFFDNPEQILLEVGPGRTLSTLAQRHPDKPKEQITLTSVRHPQDEYSDVTFLLNNLGQMWLAGLEIDWSAFYSEQPHYRIPLPTYPFERKRYWIEPSKTKQKIQPSETRILNISDSLNVEDSSKYQADSRQLSSKIELIQTPQKQLEQTLINIWQQVLGIDNIGLDDNFFELGGDSLVGVQLLSKLRKNIDLQVYSGLELSLNQLFKTPTIAELLANVTIRKTEEQVTNASQSLTIPLRTNKDSALLSFSQQSLWFLHQLKPDRSDYHLSVAAHLQGSLNLTALQQALDAIVGHHEALRTNFIIEDDTPIQIIRAARPVELRIFDLQNHSQTEQEAQHLLEQELQRPFNLSQDLMLRGCLVQVAAQEYILLLVMHHIASDGWSVGILTRQLHELYQAFSQGQPSPLQKLPIQYADFAEWQRQYLQNEILESAVTYWKKHLAGAPELLSLPTDRPRPAVQSFRGNTVSFVLPNQITEGLNLLSKKEKVTPFMTMLAAFNTLLYRYTNSEDIVIGSPQRNRNFIETQELIGFFVNPVVLRTDLSGNPSFKELLGRVREVALGAYEHQDLPIEKLVEVLNPRRDLSYSPVFQVMLVFNEGSSQQKIALPGISVTPWEIQNRAAQFDVTLYLNQSSTGMVLSWEYNTDLFDNSTIERMNGNFQTLLAGIAAAPELPISELPLLTADEQQQLLCQWNQTRINYPQDKCIHQLFVEQAERTPEKIAVVFKDQTISYKVLNERANQLAHYLQKLGVQPNSLVGICVERSLEMLIGLLGILKAGAAYVPIDPYFPGDRVEYMLDNAQVKVLLTQQRLVENIPTQGASVICLDTDWHDIAQAPQENPIGSINPEDLAYVIYTSGSTGKPKGVQVLHRGVVNFLTSMQQQPGINSEDILLSVTTLSFDIAVLELFLPLTVGAQVVLLSREAAMDGRKLSKTISELGITIMQATPATWRLMLEAGWKGEQKLKILCGGEAISKELATELLEKCAQLWNLYGPTETTIWSTIYQVRANESRIPIGKPIANTEIYILDSFLQPVSVGVPGELHIGGDGLAKGYLKRPDLTAEKFIPNPFSEIEGARIYKTGDLARYLPDGNIECLGRLDFQVKIRGFRIELGEIESVLVQHPNVKQAVVIVREDAPGDKRLVAYIVPLENQTPNTSELRRLLKDNVPDYMVPSAFVFLDVLPLTPNGKVDRKALPLPVHTDDNPISNKLRDSASENIEKTFVVPRDDLDLQIIKIWEKVLNIFPINMQDNFFELGGHSLLAISLINQLEKIYNKELPLSILFRSPTVEKLANSLREEGCLSSSQSLVAIQEGGSRPPLFCIYGVFLYYALAKSLGEDQPVYGVYIKEEVDVVKNGNLEQSSNNLVSIADLATRYLQEIRRHQPQGPYFLAGESLGGLVALEMAQQLHLQGEKVALLCLMDTPIPGRNQLSLKQRLDFHRRNLAREGISYLVKKMQSKLNPGNGKATNTDVRGEFRNYALTSYKPQPYSGKAVLFRAMDESHFTALQSWHELIVEGLEIHDIPGDHLGILQEPHVQILAEKLKAHINQALTQVE